MPKAAIKPLRGQTASVKSFNGEQIARARRELEKFPALQRIHDKLAGAVHKFSNGEARHKHAIGLAVLDVQQDDEKYGKRSVATLAVLLGYDKSTLNDYARVAATWKTARDLQSVLREKNELGASPTFSHLVELTQLTLKSERDRMLARVRRENLTVEQLRLILRGDGDDTNDSDDTDGEPKEARDVRRMAATWRGEIDQLKRRTDWVILRAAENPTAQVLGELKGCAEQQRGIAAQAEENAKKLDAEREKLAQQKKGGR